MFGDFTKVFFDEKLVGSDLEPDSGILRFGMIILVFIVFKGGGLPHLVVFLLILLIYFHFKLVLCHPCLCFTLAGLRLRFRLLS